jgi:hypothetical protein
MVRETQPLDRPSTTSTLIRKRRRLQSQSGLPPHPFRSWLLWPATVRAPAMETRQPNLGGGTAGGDNDDGAREARDDKPTSLALDNYDFTFELGRASESVSFIEPEVGRRFAPEAPRWRTCVLT